MFGAESGLEFQWFVAASDSHLFPESKNKFDPHREHALGESSATCESQLSASDPVMLSGRLASESSEKGRVS